MWAIVYMDLMTEVPHWYPTPYVFNEKKEAMRVAKELKRSNTSVTFKVVERVEDGKD